jgi:hypothetical protein
MSVLRIRVLIPDTNFSIPDPGQKDSGSRARKKDLSILSQKIVAKLSGI